MLSTYANRIRFGRTDTIGSLDSPIESYISDLTASTDELLKRTDMEEIHVNQIAREIGRAHV